MILLVIFCLTSCITASDLEGSLLGGLTLFGEPGHDDTRPVVSSSDDLVQELHVDATNYVLKCGKTGEYTAFCEALPYQFYCDPTTGKGSARVSNVLCGLFCACKKASADTAVSADGASDEEEGSVASVPAEVVNAALIVRQSVSDIPECAVSQVNSPWLVQTTLIPHVAEHFATSHGGAKLF